MCEDFIQISYISWSLSAGWGGWSGLLIILILFLMTDLICRYWREFPPLTPYLWICSLNEINELSCYIWWRCVIPFCPHVLKWRGDLLSWSPGLCQRGVHMQGANCNLLISSVFQQAVRVEEMSGYLKQLWCLVFEPVKGKQRFLCCCILLVLI